MGRGDYGHGAILRPIMVNITFDGSLQVDHVGIGYHVLLPSGRVHESGYTWHSPRGGLAVGPSEHIGPLQDCMTALLKAAAEHEGIALRISTTREHDQ